MIYYKHNFGAPLHMIRRFSPFIGSILAAALSAGPVVANAESLTPQTAAAIDAAMAESIGSGWVAGGVVEVARHGQPIFAKAYGFSNLEMAVPTSTTDVFRVGSLTKQFTAAGVLLLVQDGRIGLEDRVSKVLPEFPKDDATTIRQLLNHTSGIADYVGTADFETRAKWLPLTTTDLQHLVYAARPFHKFAPGTDWAYSSSNYVLATAIIESVSGKPLGLYLRDRIFQPLGMKNTALDDGRDLVARRASGYDRIAVESAGYQPARTISMTVPSGAGALRSTAGDLVIWSEALAHGALLTPGSHEQMTSPARLNDGALPSSLAPDGTRTPILYGLGLSRSNARPDAVQFHDGAIDGFTSRLSYYPVADVEVVVLVNTSPSDHLPISKIIGALRADPSLDLQRRQ